MWKKGRGIFASVAPHDLTSNSKNDQKRDRQKKQSTTSAACADLDGSPSEIRICDVGVCIGCGHARPSAHPQTTTASICGRKETHLHVMSSLPWGGGPHAILRSRQNKHASAGFFRAVPGVCETLRDDEPVRAREDGGSGRVCASGSALEGVASGGDDEPGLDAEDADGVLPPMGGEDDVEVEAEEVEDEAEGSCGTAVDTCMERYGDPGGQRWSSRMNMADGRTFRGTGTG